MRKKLIAANWKMYKTPHESENFVNALLPHQGYRPCWWVARHTQPVVDVCSDCSVTPTRSQ